MGTHNELTSLADLGAHALDKPKLKNREVLIETHQSKYIPVFYLLGIYGSLPELKVHA